MTELSPAAQAAIQAFNARYELCGPLEDNWHEVCLAAAVRALADQVVPEHFISDQSDSLDRFDAGAECRNQEIRADLLAVAAELKGGS